MKVFFGSFQVNFISKCGLLRQMSLMPAIGLISIRFRIALQNGKMSGLLINVTYISCPMRSCQLVWDSCATTKVLFKC